MNNTDLHLLWNRNLCLVFVENSLRKEIIIKTEEINILMFFKTEDKTSSTFQRYVILTAFWLILCHVLVVYSYEELLK